MAYTFTQLAQEIGVSRQRIDALFRRDSLPLDVYLTKGGHRRVVNNARTKECISNERGKRIFDVPTVTEIFADLIMAWNKSLNSARKIQDEREWDRDTCSKVKLQLQPIVDFCTNKNAQI